MSAAASDQPSPSDCKLEKAISRMRDEYAKKKRSNFYGVMTITLNYQGGSINTVKYTNEDWEK